MPKTWKDKLIDKFPKLTRQQVFLLFALLAIIALIIFVPFTIDWGKFHCEKGAVKTEGKK